MRQLTSAELELISGGSGDEDEIVVTGSPYPSPTPMPAPWPGTGPGYPPPSSPPPSGGGGTYSTPGVSAAANSFANAHSANHGTTALDQQTYQRLHDDLAKFYDFATAHPNQLIDIGAGKMITFNQALQDFQHVTDIITDDSSLSTGSGSTGAATHGTYVNGVATFTTYIDPQAGNYGTYSNQSGYDYEVFHEMGHVDNFYQDNANYTNEADANTAAKSIESAMGIPLLNANGTTVTPTGGYNP